MSETADVRNKQGLAAKGYTVSFGGDEHFLALTEVMIMRCIKIQ